LTSLPGHEVPGTGDNPGKFAFRVPGAVTAKNQLTQNDMADKHIVIIREGV
jgi:hypothetical protein